MQIYIKGIKNIKNNWKPQEEFQEYFNLQKLNNIINEENLNIDMICIQNVEYNYISQTISNIQFDCDKYNNEFIFYIKTDLIIKGRSYYWGYVTDKRWNTANKIIIDLTLDLISSNLDLFNNNEFVGQVYTERTNNRLRCINDIHTDVCVNIKNTDKSLQNLSKDLNKNIDTFIERKVFDEPHLVKVISPEGNYNFTVRRRGVIFTDGKFDANFYTNTPMINIKELIPKGRLPDLLDDTIRKWRGDILADGTWVFANSSDFSNFVNEVRQNSRVTTGEYILSFVDRITTDKNTNSWLSVPKIFDIGDSIFEDFTFNLEFEYDLKIHLNLHYNYYFIANDLFKIPIDIIKLKGKTLYGTRIVNSAEVIFNFFYEKEKIDFFHTIKLGISNGLISDEYAEYLRQLDIAFKTGQRGINIPNIAQSIVTTLTGVGLSAITGGFSSGIGSVLAGFGLNTAINTGFTLYKDKKQLEYEKLKILEKPSTSSNIALNESIYKILFNGAYVLEWARLEWEDFIGYVGIKQQSMNIPWRSNNFQLLIEKPIICNIEQINNDQNQFGNILNEFLINTEEYQNPLILNEVIPTNVDHLYWKGKINPKINPIDNFHLDFLNKILALGIKILKI